MLDVAKLTHENLGNPRLYRIWADHFLVAADTAKHGNVSVAYYMLLLLRPTAHDVHAGNGGDRACGVCSHEGSSDQGHPAADMAWLVHTQPMSALHHLTRVSPDGAMTHLQWLPCLKF